jgi:amino acid permease
MCLFSSFTFLVFALVMAPAAIKGSLGSMKYFSVIAIFLAIYLTASVVGYSASVAVTEKVVHGIDSFLFSYKIFAVLPICLVSYSVHLNVK